MIHLRPDNASACSESIFEKWKPTKSFLCSLVTSLWYNPYSIYLCLSAYLYPICLYLSPSGYLSVYRLSIYNLCVSHTFPVNLCATCTLFHFTSISSFTIFSSSGYPHICFTKQPVYFRPTAGPFPWNFIWLCRCTTNFAFYTYFDKNMNKTTY